MCRKFAACGSLVFGRHDLLARPHPVVHREQGRRLRDQTQRLAPVGLHRVVPPVRVVRRRRRNARPEHRHRRGLLSERRHQVLQELGDLALLDHEVGERVQLRLGRQSQLVEQVDDLLVRGPAGQVVDVVADVPEPPGLPVDVGQPRLGCHDLAKASVGHRTLHLLRMVVPPIMPSESRRGCPPDHADPRGRGGARARRRRARDDRSHRRRARVGRTAGGARGHRGRRHAASHPGDRVDPAQPGRPEGTARHAVGLPERERRAARRARPVRGAPTVPARTRGCARGTRASTSWSSGSSRRTRTRGSSSSRGSRRPPS